MAQIIEAKKVATQNLGEIVSQLPKNEHDFILGMVFSSVLRQQRKDEEDGINRSNTRDTN